MTGSDVIATAALVFAVASFYVLNALPGKLQIVGEPRSFAFAATDKVHLTLPLVFTNSRPLATIAINLRLRLDAPGFPRSLPFVATVDGIYSPKGRRDFATAVVVQGRETRLICCELISAPFDATGIKAGEVRAAVDAYVLRGWWRWRRTNWVTLVRFPVRLPKEAVEHRGQFIPYDNQAE